LPAVADILAQLDSYQYDAVTAPFDNHVLVTAGPGAGKSRVLTSRYAYMLANDIDPSNIIAVTFTNKAAGEMKSRIAQLLGIPEEKAKHYSIATFHSLCARWLRKYADRIGYRPNFTVYNQYRAQQVLQQILEQASIYHYTPNIYSAVSLLKNYMITPDALPLLAATGELPRKIMNYGNDFSTLAQVYKSYIETMRSMNVMDFDDLLYYTVLLFDDISPFDDLGIRYVLQDEMQDMNATQYSILSRIADAGAYLYFVGDTDQTLYAFRGAYPDLVETFVVDYEPLQKRLIYNYRSCAAIVNVSSGVIKPSYDDSVLSYVPIRAVRQGGSVDWFNLSEEELIIPAVVSLVKSLLSSTPPEQIAVLCRYNRPLTRVWRALLSQHIPSRLHRGHQDLDTPLLNLIAAVSNPSDVQAIRNLLLSLKSIGKALADKVIKYLKSRELQSPADLAPALDSCADLFKQEKQRDSLSTLTRAVTVVTNGIDHSPYPLDCLLNQASALLYQAVKNAEQYTEQDEVLLAAAALCSSTLEDLTELVTLANLSGDHSKDAKDAVVLSTIHGAKGLEYSVVVIPDFSSGYNREDPDDPYGERRIFYVALTRAIERAYIVTAYPQYQLNVPSMPCFVRDMLSCTDVRPQPFRLPLPEAANF